MSEPSSGEIIGIPVEVRRWRVLFSDGETVDFLVAGRLDSNHAAAMLDHHFGKRPKSKRDLDLRIEGSVDLGVVYEHTPEMPKRRRLRQGATDGPTGLTTSPSSGTRKTSGRPTGRTQSES